MVESVINPVTMTERESCQLRGEEVEIFSIPKVRVFVRFFTGGIIFFTGIFQIQRSAEVSGVGSPENWNLETPRNMNFLGWANLETQRLGLKFEHFE